MLNRPANFGLSLRLSCSLRFVLECAAAKTNRLETWQMGKAEPPQGTSSIV